MGVLPGRRRSFLTNSRDLAGDHRILGLFDRTGLCPGSAATGDYLEPNSTAVDDRQCRDSRPLVSLLRPAEIPVAGALLGFRQCREPAISLLYPATLWNYLRRLGYGF